MVIAGSFLALVIAWICHERTSNEWMPLGFLHVFFSSMFLLWDMEEAYPVKYRLVLAGIALILSLIFGKDPGFTKISLALLGGQVLVMVLAMIPVERALKKKFG